MRGDILEYLAYGHTYNLQIAQAEKAFGELRALVAMNYDPAKGNSETYSKMKKMVEDFISEFRNEFC
jgi:CTP-dependent riboflavin kinase